MTQFDVVDLIRTKRGGGRLAPEEIDWLIDAYTTGVIADEQMSAMAMAVFFRGMDDAELSPGGGPRIAGGARRGGGGAGAGGAQGGGPRGARRRGPGAGPGRRGPPRARGRRSRPS